MPLLLLFTTFLFINAEVWQVAGTLSGIVYVAVLGIFFVLGAVFVLSRIPSLMRDLNRFDDWSEVGDLVVATPAAGVLSGLDVDVDQRPPPAGRTSASGSTSGSSRSSPRPSR